MDALIEITVSDKCNKNCQYCFERRASRVFGDLGAFEWWEPRIVKLCEDIDSGLASKYDGVQLTFWGGEPFLRPDRMLDLIRRTSKYGFVSYHVYTNGTLCDETTAFVSDPSYKAVAGRFFVQVSYDGDPCNQLRRGYGFDQIRRQAEAFRAAGSPVSFKATVCYEDVGKFPELWNSYALLAREWPGLKYSPTLDSFGGENVDMGLWRDVVERLCAREYWFCRKNGRFLMSWFDDEVPRKCRLDNRIFLHSDGGQYVCHGCPYSDDRRLRLGSIEDPGLQFMHAGGETVSSECKDCCATYCVYCNMAGMPNGDLRQAWNASRASNFEICDMYRVFGWYRRALIYSLIKGK